MANSAFNKLINSDKPVLVDFSAEWCGPCQTLAPILKDLKNSIGDSAKIVKIDVDKNQQIAANYRIQSVPTLMIFKNGEMKWRGAGVVPAHQLESLLKEHA